MGVEVNNFFYLIFVASIFIFNFGCAKIKPKVDPVKIPDALTLVSPHNYQSKFPLPITNNFTALCWIKAKSGVESYQQILSQKSGEAWQYNEMKFDFAEYKTTGQLQANIYSVDGNWPPEKWYSSKKIVFDDTWHLVGISYATNDLKMIIDGQIAEVEVKHYDSPSGELHATTSLLSLGSNPNSDRFDFNGQIDECAIWAKVLDPFEIMEVYEGNRNSDLLKHSAADFLVNYWPLGSNLHDIIGKNHFIPGE